MKQPHAVGILLVLLSACAFGAMAIFARGAFAAGANVAGLLAGRFAIAGAILALLLVATGRRFPRGRPLVFAMAMGGIGYVGQAACFFAALQYASSGLVALLLYVYPTIVVLLAAAFLREKLTGTKLVLLAASFGGLVLMLGGGNGTPTGIGLGLAAAGIYSVYILVGSRELAGTDALASATVICLSAATTLGIASLFIDTRLPGTWWGWAAVAALGIVGGVIAILAFFAGLKRVGPAVASVVSTFEPVFTAILAWLVLGETLTAGQLAGGALVVVSAALLARAR